MNTANPRNQSTTPLSTLACLLALSSTLCAQVPPESPASQPSGGAEEEIVVLTPFEVRATASYGYVGQETLAGSRVRTSLKDLAAAISPMTAEFLRDIAVTDLVGAVEYGLNTRVDSQDGGAAAVAGSYTDVGGRPQPIRIRGLPNATRTLNYFPAPGELDTYITEQIEFSRGPNSILYGLGSPAGVINVSSKQALPNKNAHSFSHRIDSWGGQRLIADANLALVKDKLGLRAVVLRGREESWRSYGHNDQDRIYLAAKWSINSKTTL